MPTIVQFRTDNESDWVAVLACGHAQHVRHNPPWELRPWTTTPNGRERMLGHTLACRLCDVVQTGKGALESEDGKP